MKYTIKKIFILFTVLLVSASCNKAEIQNNNTPLPKYNYTNVLQINNTKLNVEIVKTQSELEHGLSDRSSMREQDGMLFDFGSTPVSPSFWMKDMKFNLDIIWLYQNKIVGITENVPFKIQDFSFKIQDLPTYSPPSPITQVLEVNAGWSKKNNIKVGDEITLIK